jgi:hypothetical protein
LPLAPLHPIASNDLQHLKRWLELVSARPAVQRGMQVPSQVIDKNQVYADRLNELSEKISSE